MTPPLLLCSGSPRRAALLASAGIAFERGEAPDVDESRPVGVAAGEVALALAEKKLGRAAARAPDRVVLCADTTVVLGDELLEKPGDPAEAVEMLARLSGRTHRVVTGVAVGRRGVVESASDEARVTFRALSPHEIADYVATGEPFGKAGGYAIQGLAASFVARLEGDVETVVGLPTRLVRALLGRLAASGGGAPGR